MIVRLKDLRRKSRFMPRGYFDAWARVGEVDGKYLRVSEIDYRRLTAQYRGWGSRLHDFLFPFVSRFDRLFKTRIRNCGGCRKRQRKLDRLWLWFRLS
jgi:hypothetical protein